MPPVNPSSLAVYKVRCRYCGSEPDQPCVMLVRGERTTTVALAHTGRWDELYRVRKNARMAQMKQPRTLEELKGPGTNAGVGWTPPITGNYRPEPEGVKPADDLMDEEWNKGAK